MRAGTPLVRTEGHNSYTRDQVASCKEYCRNAMCGYCESTDCRLHLTLRHTTIPSLRVEPVIESTPAPCVTQGVWASPMAVILTQN